MSAEVLPATLLSRKAVVYVRQSTQAQVQTNLESKRRQYDLVEAARRHGFATVEVIDDDLGRSASGSMVRPGFDRLVAAVCAGEVGAVLCLDASRLARNGRDCIACSSSADSSGRASSIPTASTIRVDRTTVCLWQERKAHCARRWARTHDIQASQAFLAVGGYYSQAIFARMPLLHRDRDFSLIAGVEPKPMLVAV